MSTLADLVSKTRDDVAIDALGAAHRRVRALEHEVESTCAELFKAQQLCHDEGIVVEFELSPAISAAFSTWKARRPEPVVVRELPS